MTLLKRLLYVIVGLIALVLIVALFVKKDYAVEREITINKPKQEVFNYLKLLQNQLNFSTYAMMDKNMKQNITGTDGTVGAIWAWEGNDDVGKGEQEIKKITEGSQIDIDLRFLKPMESTASAFFITESVSENQTKVKWRMAGTSKYPLNIMNLILDFDKLVGTEYQKSLENLKVLMEKQ